MWTLEKATAMFAAIDNARADAEERAQSLSLSRTVSPMLRVIDSGFSVSDDETYLIVWHDGAWVGRYGPGASAVDLLADARKHMAEHHGADLPYSVPAASLGGA